MKIQSIEFKLEYCPVAFTYGKPSLFSWGGGSYSDFDNYHWRNCTRHFYIWKYCVLSIHYRKYVK